MLTASSSAASVDGGALFRLGLAALIGAVGMILKKDLERSGNLGPLREWLREKAFEVFLIQSVPSPLARRVAGSLKPWLARLPGVSTDKLRILDELDHGLREVIACALGILWGASWEARRADHTLQFGMYIRVVGVGTVGLGVQYLLSGETWGLILMESALGIALLAAGHFLGSLRSRPRQCWALLPLAVVAVVLDSRFAVAGSGSMINTAVEVLRQVGSLATAMACVLVTVARVSRRSPRLQVARILLVQWGMRAAGLACVCYALANLSQAFMVAPTMFVQATHLGISLCLVFAANESRHPAASYGRLISTT